MASRKRSLPSGSSNTAHSSTANDRRSHSASPAGPESPLSRPQLQPHSHPHPHLTRAHQLVPSSDRLSPQPPQQYSPTLPQHPPGSYLPQHQFVQENVAPGSSSRRGSLSDMRSQMPMEGTTPTGRISKAKKGKRVHACEFPGCGKVFTRAEHRRRHELNHNPEARYPCPRPGCRKAFHREDLLRRHQERHDLDGGSPGRPGHSDPFIGTPSSIPPTSMPPPASESMPRSSAGGISITSIVNPHPGYEYGMHSRQPLPPFTTAMMPSFPNMTNGDDPLYQYTPEGTQSPVSEPRYRYGSGSISEPGSVVGFPHTTSPHIHPNMPSNGWVPVSSPAPPSVLPASMFQGEDLSYVQSHTESNIPIPLSDLDGHEFFVIRRELSNAPGLLPRDDGDGFFDSIRWDCLELYWQHFHPTFPIVHRPTFLPTKPSPLLASAMVAIGSIHDSREDAHLYALTLLEVATKLVRERNTISSRSRLVDQQTVVLLEYLSKYCSRRIDVQMSPRFRALIASLDQARQWLPKSPLASLRALPKNPTEEQTKKARQFWIEHETRRRIWHASLVLDTRHATLFQQQPVIIQHGHSDSEKKKGASPLPCIEELWEISPIEKWADLAREYDYVQINDATRGLVQLSPFQKEVVCATQTSKSNSTSESRRCSLEPNESDELITKFNHHASKMAKETPIRQLLTVSGESWILGRKAEKETEFQQAGQGLRAWINEGGRSKTALYHATALLRSILGSAPVTNQHSLLQGISVYAITGLLHEHWCIYIACLICWAHGFEKTLRRTSRTMSSASGSISSASNQSNPSAHPTLLDPLEASTEMYEYLNSTNVEVDALRKLDQTTLSRTPGLLETVRIQKIAPAMGGLMNEAERVLYRLVEGRSHMHHF